MSDTEGEKEHEERALDALIASAFKEDLCEVDDEEIERLRRSVSEADRAALDKALGPNFIQTLFAGTARKRDALEARGELSTAMNRSDEETPPTDAAQAEMEEKIREADERRKAKEEQDQRSSDDDGR